MALPDYVDKEEDERLDESTREDDLALLSTYVKALKEVNEDLADYEQLKMIVVAPEPWTVENGYLTPTMKIRRRSCATP